MMFIAMNRFRVKKGFEEVFAGRVKGIGASRLVLKIRRALRIILWVQRGPNCQAAETTELLEFLGGRPLRQ
jgi:hypothetical protein